MSTTGDHAQRRLAHLPFASVRRMIRREVWIRDRGVCQICGGDVDPDLSPRHPEGGTMDHVIPFSRGGLYTVENLQLAHLACNLARGCVLINDGTSAGVQKQEAA